MGVTLALLSYAVLPPLPPVEASQGGKSADKAAELGEAESGQGAGAGAGGGAGGAQAGAQAGAQGGSAVGAGLGTLLGDPLVRVLLLA